jgi:hypothetical protein
MTNVLIGFPSSPDTSPNTVPHPLDMLKPDNGEACKVLVIAGTALASPGFPDT